MFPKVTKLTLSPDPCNSSRAGPTRARQKPPDVLLTKETSPTGRPVGHSLSGRRARSPCSSGLNQACHVYIRSLLSPQPHGESTKDPRVKSLGSRPKAERSTAPERPDR